MANTSEEILLTIGGRDDASQMFANIDRNAQSMVSNISAAMSKVNTGLMNLSQVGDNVIQSLTGKSALDNILGSASKNETNMVLLENMLEDVEKNYDSFYKTVDSTTDQSLTSMQELIPALNALNAATGATDKELENITPNVANFGAAVLAQTGSVDRAQQAMMDLSKGYKGAYASLDQYGITEDALARAGYNEGDGLEKYMDAVTKVVGSTDKLMETNQGLDALIGKSFSRAGKKIGNEFLPIIKDVKRGFIDLDSEMGGAIAGSMLLGEAAIESGNRVMWNIHTAADGIRDLHDAFKLLTGGIQGAEKAAEGMSDAMNMGSNISDIAAGTAGLGGAIGGGAEATKTASKGEKAVEGGMDALLMADMLKGNKTANKEAEKVVKEVSRSEKLYDEIREFNLKANAKRASMMSGVSPEKVLANLKRDTKGLSDALSKSSEFMYDDDLLREWEESGQTFTGAIKGKVTGFKTRLTRAFSSIRNFDLKGTITSPFKSIISSIQGFSFGGALQSGLEKSMGGLGNIASTIKGKFTSFGTTLAGIKDIDIGAKLKGLDKKAYQSIKGFSFKDTLSGLKESISGLRGTADVIEEAGDISKTLEGAGDIAVGMEAVAGAGEAVAVAGPEMAAGAAGAGAASAGATGLAASFTSMIVPLLAISAVIIIMIPIVSVIAAEAMFFIKLLGEFMEALHFEDIDLDGAIKGIKSIATALTWIGIAMSAMTFAGITTAIAFMTGGLLSVLGLLPSAVDTLMAVGKELLKFSSIKIDDSIPNTINNIGKSFNAISLAMLSLTATNITTSIAGLSAWVLQLGSVNDAISTATSELIYCGNTLQQFNSITIDDSIPNTINNISESLKAVSDTMMSLTATTITVGFSNFVAWALQFGSVTDALDEAKNDIIAAAGKLNEFSSLSLDENTAKNIQNVCDSLASVGDAIGALRTLRDNHNWDEGLGGMIRGLFGDVDIQAALTAVKDDIIKASQSLAQFNGISEIPEDVASKIKAVSDTLSKVSEAFETLRGFRDDINWDDFMQGLFGGADISSALDQVKNDIKTAAEKLSELSSIPEISEDTTTKIGQVGSALSKVSEVVTSLSSLPQMGDFDSSTISTAVTNVQTAANELSKLSGLTVGEDVNGVLTNINTALQTLKDTLTNATGFSTASVNIGSQIVSGVQTGITPLGSTVQGAVSSAISSASPQATSGGNTLGKNATDGMKSALHLKSTMDTEVGYALTAMTSRTQEFYDAGASLAKAASDGFDSNNGLDHHSPGRVARSMADEMKYTLDAMKSKYSAAYNMAAGLGQSIYQGFGNPTLDMDMFTNGGQLTAEYIGALQTVVSRAPEKADNRPVTIIVSEGAVTVDARNKTEQEAKGILTLALESMDHITNVDVDGV